jgi:hypothetical protein
LATKAALATGGMTYCFFRCGLRSFFLALIAVVVGIGYCGRQ